jgi:putative transcriptional regulator
MSEKKSIEPIKGQVLISDPFLPDPNFSRTVVLLTEHNDSGTFGLVLNKLTDLTLDTVLGRNDFPEIPIYQGGPVQLDTLHFIHSFGGALSGSIKIMEGLWWGGDFAALSEIICSDDYKKEQFKFFIGYSGWSAGQLKDEIVHESWLLGKVHPKEALARNSDNKLLWNRAMKNRGGSDKYMANSPLDPQWN